MSVKEALVSLVGILSDSDQKKLLLEASKLVQDTAAPELVVMAPQPRIVIEAVGKVRPGKKQNKKKKVINKVKKPMEVSKLNTPKGPFNVFGVEKDSCRAVAIHFGIKYGTFLHHVRKPGASMEDVITFLTPTPTASILPETGRVPVRRRPKAENMVTH